VNRVVRRLADGFVTAVLRSPLHGLMSGSLLLISFTGRRTGQEHSRPVMFAEDEGGLIILVGHAEQKVWWRNLSEGAPVRVRVRGREIEGYGEVVRGDSSSLAARYLERFPRARSAISRANEPVFVRVRDLRPTSAG
jgi:deazaflavin-dependent oxidoreductase (nitroreductase family)